MEWMGVSLANRLDVAPARPSAPTFAEYVPVVVACRRGSGGVYGSYRNWVVQAWGERRVDEPVPSEVELPATSRRCSRRL